MTTGEDFMEPLIYGDVRPPPITPTVFTVVDNHSVVTRPLSNGLSNNLVGHDLEEMGTSVWVWGEVREQLWLAGPIMVMYAMQYVMATGGIVFVGHLGAFSLAAMTLANSFCGITGYTILTGLASALETLCGQAHGAKQYDLLGIYLQRAIFILTLAALPVGVVWLNMARILIALGEDPAIADAAQTFTYLLYPTLIMFGVLMPLIKFFQTQGAVFQLMISMGVVAVLHVGLCWLFIDKVGVGFHGSAMAMNITLVINICILSAFVRYSPRFEKTFTSFSMEAFQDFSEFLSLALPSATMMCLETWSYEILTLLSGLIPNPELNISSFAICLGLLSLANLTGMALGVATSVRVSNELGAGKARGARSVVAVSVTIGLANGVAVATSIYLLRNIWGHAFTNDLEVVQHVAHTAPYLAVLAILYTCQAILSGVMRGVGWQRAGAIANLGAYYGVGLPTSLVSVFLFRSDSKGLWLGMGVALLTQTSTLIVIILSTDWDKLAQEAVLRSHSYKSRLPTSAPPLLKALLDEEEQLPRSSGDPTHAP